MKASVQKRQHELNIIRDTVESVWVAIILAFVLRAFMVEAFVIPTGSMAPRLMGEHHDLVCGACGYEYSFGWDHHRRGSVNRRDKVVPEGASCPSCTCKFHTKAEYVNGGDRVLVMKYLYRFADPKPFDVVVFRNPQSNDNNYIKRLIGLPGETIEIVHGDVYVVAPGQKTAKIRRKPDRAQEVMWQIVCDNDYRPDMAKFEECEMYLDAPRRWARADEGAGERTEPWSETNNGRTFVFKGSEEYSHLTFKGVRVQDGNMSPDEIDDKSAREAFVPRYGYNPGYTENRYPDSSRELCSDLKVSLVIKPGQTPSDVECVLDGLWYSVKAVYNADGTVTLLRRTREPKGPSGGASQPDADADRWTKWASAKASPMTPGQGRKLELAHVDHGAKVWIDGEKVIDETYEVTLGKLKQRLDAAVDKPLPIPGARIGVKGGGMEMTHLKLVRDVYYMSTTLPSESSENPDFLLDYARGEGDKARSGEPGWGVAGNPIKLRKRAHDSDLDEFYVLGDNSPQSLDSRGWREAAPSLRLLDKDKKRQYRLGTVPRYNMIGKAMFVYWPSGYRLPLFPGIPIIPDVGRMRLIR